MTSASVRQRVTQNRAKVLASINAAMATIAKDKVTTAAPASLPAAPELPSAPPTLVQQVQSPQIASEPADKSRNLVRWNDREFALIAREVSSLLRKERNATPPELIEAVMHAQAKVLPRERWRPRSGVSQACYKTDRTKLMERLREAMKTQTGLHVPPAAPTPNAPAAASAPAPSPTPISASEPPAPAPAPTAQGSAIEEAIVALVRKVVREGMPILAQAVAEHAVGLLRGDLLSDIDKTVRKGVTDVVGGPTEPQVQQQQPPQPQVGAAPLSVVPTAAVPPTPEKQRVDVIGLLNAQANVVRSAMGKAFDLRFIDSNFAEHQRSVAPIVVLCTKFVNHSAQEKARSRGAHVLFANGAAQSVIEQLQHLQTKRPHDLHASARA